MTASTPGELVRAAVLGLVQGMTEFLPVSSSGHLVILPELLGWPPPGLSFDVAVHVATAAAVLIAFRDDWLTMLTAAARGVRHGRPLEEPAARLLALLVLASLPAAVAGLALESAVEAFLSEGARSAARASAAMLLVTGALLASSEARGARAATDPAAPARLVDAESLGPGRAMLIGVAQAVAIIPGISRSGATIAAGLALGLPRAEAARFSFLLATPIIFGAGSLRLADLAAGDGGQGQAPSLLAVGLGATVAGIVGFASIAWLMRILRGRSLFAFAAYTWAFGLLALLLLA